MFGVAAISRDAATSPRSGPWLGLLAVVHATHDIACDGFYMQALDNRGQALYSGVRIGRLPAWP